MCHRDGVTCLGHRTFRFGLASPVRWHIPERFGVDSGAGVSPHSVESYWYLHGNNAGVSVLEMIGPAGLDSRPAPGHTGTTSPHTFAEWLSTPPFLSARAPVRARVGGRPGWHVRVQLAPGVATGPGLCSNSFDCYPVARTDTGDIFGIWADMVADYTFVRLPSGTAMVWSWAFGHDTAALARNRAAVDGISWPAH